MSGLVQPTALLGQWQLTRQVRDERADLSGTASGQLTLLAESDEIVWHEHGILLWNAARLAFSRSYRMRRVDNEWWLFFADGRPFHRWQLDEWVDHPCRDDLYRGFITFAGPDAWQTEWKLRGPGKEQRITTQFARRADMGTTGSVNGAY